MTSVQVQAFLEDLARLTLRHGLALRDTRGGMCLGPMMPGFEGYSAVPPGDGP